MNKFRFTIKLLAIAIFMVAFASVAHAQATRTWVSGVGDDANPCSRTAPCKTFAGAISKTANCGEIDALDPGGFGAVTITKSITIDGTGTLAGILASLTTGVIINATATDVITLRGLTINGACNGIRGMNILQAKTVNIEDCVIFRFANEGILVNESSDMALNVKNSVIRDNVGDGISTVTSSGSLSIKTTLDNVHLTGNANGLHARSGSRVTARNCVFSNNTVNGVFSDAAGTNFVNAFIWSSQISMNGANGVQSGKAGNLGISGATVSQNQIDRNVGSGALISTGGVVSTFSNNSIFGNGVDGCVGCTNVGPGS
ncbi:MAG: right-handed parallel beta-helix repeat-containing protein [Pyrinomonadaceae bacterium]|nr:right-handed parallel beta-helix repeat-containing protein [Pyrinomonadaceae bacterium]